MPTIMRHNEVDLGLLQRATFEVRAEEPTAIPRQGCLRSPDEALVLRLDASRHEI